MGSIPVNHPVHGIRIFNNYLYIWERRNAVVYLFESIAK